MHFRPIPPNAYPDIKRLSARSIYFPLVVLLSAFLFPYHSAAQPELVKQAEFSFAVSGEYRPFSYVDKQGQLQGFDIEVGKRIAAYLKLTPKPVKYKFAGIIEGVKSGRFDVAIASHTVTAERLEHVNFSTPYYFAGPQVFTRGTLAIDQVNRLGGKEIAVSKGSTYAQIAADYTGTIRLYDSDVTALQALASGRHDAVITDSIVGKMSIKNGVNLIQGVTLGNSAQAVAIAKDKPHLLTAVNEALKHLHQSGELARLSMEFFADDITKTPNGYKPVSLEKKDSSQSNSQFNHFVNVLVSSSPLFLKATLLTVLLTIVSILAGSFIGLFFAFLNLSKVPPLRWIAQIYIYLVRGTPLIVQIFILYFGLTSIVQIPAFWAAAIALAVHNGGYIAEIFRGAISSIDKGQFDAAKSLGMNLKTTYKRIVLPQAFLRALPPLGNQMIISLKDSSLAAFISMNELFNVATTAGANNFDQMTYLLVCAVYYLVLVLILTLIVGRVESRLSKGIFANE